MSSGSPLSAFRTFMESQGPTIIGSPTDLVNDAQRQNRYLLRTLLRGRDAKDLLQGGTHIQFRTLLSAAGTARTYKPGATVTWQNPQSGTNGKAYWRYWLDHMAWTAQEMRLNAPTGMTQKAMAHKFKDVRFQKEQRMWTSMLDFMEDLLLQSAHSRTADMEAESGETPNSLHAFVNEETNGLANGWTTKENINPATESRWVPQRSLYDYADVLDSDDGYNGLLNAFDELWAKVQFESPGTQEQYFTEDAFGRQVIGASRAGQKVYKDALRKLNDILRAGPQDPAYNQPLYSGVPVKEFTKLGTEPYYAASSGYVSEDGTQSTAGGTITTEGPRFYFWNFNYIRLFFDATRFFHKHDVREPTDQIDSFVQPISCWGNLVCESMLRQGMIAPGG